MREAVIEINGWQLTPAQSMTLRVAMESFAADLDHHGLGEDYHGKRMTTAYLDRISEIRVSMYKNQ